MHRYRVEVEGVLAGPKGTLVPLASDSFMIQAVCADTAAMRGAWQRCLADESQDPHKTRRQIVGLTIRLRRETS